MRHLLSLLPPLVPLVFLLTAPHPWHWLLLFLCLPLAFVLLDACCGRVHNSRYDGAQQWPFDLLLCAHAVIHFILLALYLRLAMRLGMRSADFWVGALLVGYNAGWSAIVVTHELIHRRQQHLRLLGRAILCSLFYDHFYTEHLRGHHARVATSADAATARFGESLVRFKLRSIPAQFASAWRIEHRRAGLLHNRVFQGVMVQLAMMTAVILLLGVAPALALVLVAFRAINLLETVNYVEHWGLIHDGKQSRAVDTWDTDSAFTHYVLMGIARHTDHHANPTRPFHCLRHVEEAPRMPRGYFGMILLAHMRNAAFRRIMTAELERLRLGPFATDHGRIA